MFRRGPGFFPTDWPCDDTPVRAGPGAPDVEPAVPSRKGRENPSQSVQIWRQKENSFRR